MPFNQPKEQLPGLSNNGVASAGGYPSSGAMQPAGAAAKTLPPQRQGEPFQTPQNGGSARGTLNGQAVAGSQFKTTPQPMSPGVASYVGIPTNPAQFKPPGGALPLGANVFQGGGGPSFIAANQAQGQFQQAAGRAPGATTPPQAQPAPIAMPGAAPVATGPSWMPNNVAQFGQGSPWQQAQAAAFELKQMQNLQAQQQAAAMRGRGGSVQSAGAGYQNLLGDVAFAGQMADVQQQAAQQDFQNQMAYTQQLNNTKMELAQLAKSLGMTLDDAQFNQLAAETLQQFGENASPGSMLQMLQSSGSISKEQKRKIVRDAMPSEYHKNLVDQMSDEELNRWYNEAKG